MHMIFSVLKFKLRIYILVRSYGTGETTNFYMEKKLLEASDMNEIKELLIKLHAASGGSRSFANLFCCWEIAIPIQNGILNILPGAFQDYIHILVAKSKQLLNIKVIF